MLNLTFRNCIYIIYKNSQIQAYWEIAPLFTYSFLPQTGMLKVQRDFILYSCLALTNLMLNKDNHYDLNHSNAYFM